ncbi:MAG: acyl carrier protein [Planctomycetia bacterium]
MSDDARIREAVLTILGGIAPEADLASLEPDAQFRRELDLDSVDFQTFVIRLSKELGVTIPERDVGQIATLAGCTRYCARILGEAAAAAPPKYHG